jgi:two-component system, LytTR family, sensor kinase
MFSATLINLLGFVVGTALYGLLLAMVLRDRRRDDAQGGRLLIATAGLGLVWNIGEFIVYASRDVGFTPAPAIIPAIAYSALGFLPSVVVHSARRSLKSAGIFSAVLTISAYGLSASAAVLHLHSGSVDERAPDELAMKILTFASIGFLVGLLLIAMRQKLERKAIWVTALLIFAVSSLHLSTHDGQNLWVIELVAHQSSLPLAFAILMQDFRFAFADLFLKRALSLMLLALLAFGLYIYVAVPLLAWHETHETDDAQAAFIVIGLWIVTALTYPLLHRAAVWFVDKIILRRSDYGSLESDVTAALSNFDEEHEVLDEVTRLIANSLNARESSWKAVDVKSDEPRRSNVSLETNIARVFIPTVDPAFCEVTIRNFAGGRRLLSDELRMLESVAVATARRIDAIRVAHERFEMELRSEKLSKFATEAELLALRSQINPHFLFNALTTIGYLIKTTPDKAFGTLMNLTNLLRGVLKSGTEFSTLGEEMRLIENYLDIEKARFEERLEITIDVSESLAHLKIPTLVIQPLVENAVKHGISQTESGGTVSVSAELCEDESRLTVRVSDTGVGIGSTGNDGNGIGLENIRKRIESYFGERASLSVASRSTGGTEAVIVIPVERRESV